MSQIDLAIDVPAILTQDALRDWNPGSYDALVVLHPTASSKVLPAPLKAGSTTQQQLASAAMSLWNDDLPTAHAAFQEDESSNGSLWHAILHRREGDFSNSKYWLARAGKHPVYEVLGPLARTALKSVEGEPLFSPLLRAGWNGPAFVDLVRQVSNSDASSGRSLAVQLQQLEWRALFCHCAR